MADSCNSLAISGSNQPATLSPPPPLPLIWDIPAPLDLADIVLFDQPEPLRRLDTVKLSRCWGLTFFISAYGTEAVHMHTRHSPTAEATFDRANRYAEGQVVWAYVPLPSSDPLQRFGIRRYSNSIQFAPYQAHMLCTYLVSHPPI